MATSSFDKRFIVKREKATEFTEEMTKRATPTLQSDFQSRFMYLSQDRDLKSIVGKVLTRN